jgi:hypothetical protein
MKKGKILIVALIGLLMAGGLVLAGCEEDKPKCVYDYFCGPGANATINANCGKDACYQGMIKNINLGCTCG